MEGRVESVMPAINSGHRVLDFRVAVSSAQPDKKAAPESYTDCAEYVGRSVELRLPLPRQHGRPAEGDWIVFTRSVVNSFDDPTTGDTVSSVQVKLLAYEAGIRD